MAISDRVAQFKVLVAQALADLFDQRKPFGRLALVQVLMLAGDTLVTVSLAGSLFFSISPTEAKSKVFLYLVLTLAPFAVVSPLLGPLIDRSRGARRGMVMFAGAGRAVICPFMAANTHNLLLFPLAFLILVLSKLYLVTRGALVPEMANASPDDLSGPITGRSGRTSPAAPSHGPVTEVPPEVPSFWHGEALGFPVEPEDRMTEGSGTPSGAVPAGDGATVAQVEFATLNARLTLLGTLAGFVASIPGVILLKTAGAPGVLVFTAFVFAAAAVAGARLPVRRGPRPLSTKKAPPSSPVRPASVQQPLPGLSAEEWPELAADPDLAQLQPIAHPEVLLGLTTMSLIRGLAGFLVFLLAFGLRRLHAGLEWYGLALGASGVGALIGLTLVARMRRRLAEPQIILGSIWLIAAAAIAVSFSGGLVAQAGLALVVGIAGALAQPSFDAMTQRYVPVEAQGRAFARFATRQQLVWCLGALIPVVLSIPLAAGDVVMGVVAGLGGLGYFIGRRALRSRALPRQHRAPPEG